MAKKELSDGGPDGTSFGQSATDKIAFFGGTPVVKATTVTTATVTAPVLGATAAYGFSTTAQFADVVNAVAALKAYGLV